MQYRDFGKTGEKVSALGFGCMRFPVISDENSPDKGKINRPEAIKMLRDAIDSGVNYIDTAWGYHNGESEFVVGEALSDGYREKVFLATKMPVWEVNEKADFQKIFNRQLEKLKTDHVDMYMLHALGNGTFHDKVLKFDLMSEMRRLKAEGKVKYIGFSFHDNFDVFKNIVDSYEGCDFCQIQLNYIDVENQAGIKGLEYAASKGLAVIIMEPLLGGQLANPSVQVKNALDASRTPVQWALDFLWNRPEVSLLLSGMSNYQQTVDNLRYADESAVGKLSAAELEMMARAKKIFDGYRMVECTGCEYCMPCPAGLHIPEIFKIYNKYGQETQSGDPAKEYASLETKASACAECGQCEEACPQHIEIRNVMKQIAKTFE